MKKFLFAHDCIIALFEKMERLKVTKIKAKKNKIVNILFDTLLTKMAFKDLKKQKMKVSQKA